MINDPIIKMIKPGFYKSIKIKLLNQKRYYGLLIPDGNKFTPLTSIDVELLHNIPTQMIKDVAENLNFKSIQIIDGLLNFISTMNTSAVMVNTISSSNNTVVTMEDNFNG